MQTWVIGYCHNLSSFKFWSLIGIDLFTLCAAMAQQLISDLVERISLALGATSQPTATVSACPSDPRATGLSYYER